MLFLSEFYHKIVNCPLDAALFFSVILSIAINLYH